MGILRKKKEKKPTFKGFLTAVLATAAAIFLLLLAGLSLTGTAVAFVATMPLFVVFSPVLVPAGIASGLLATGLAASGSSGAMAVSVILWIYKRVTGKEPPAFLPKILKKIIPAAGGSTVQAAANNSATPAAESASSSE